MQGDSFETIHLRQSMHVCLICFVVGAAVSPICMRLIAFCRALPPETRRHAYPRLQSLLNIHGHAFGNGIYPSTQQHGWHLWTV